MKIWKDEINTYDLCNLALKSFYHSLGYLVSLKTILQIRYSTNHGMVLKQAIVLLSFVNIRVILKYRRQNSCFRTMGYQCFKRNNNSTIFAINNFQHSSPIFFLIFSLGSHQIKVPNTAFSWNTTASRQNSILDDGEEGIRRLNAVSVKYGQGRGYFSAFPG